MQTLHSFAILSLFLIQTVVSDPRWYTSEDGTRFLIDTEHKYNWYQALHECARQDAQLVVIDSEAKNLQIVQILKGKFFAFFNLWIGGNDAFGDRQDKLRPFYWSATGKQFSYTNWAEDQPDNFRNKEHCVHVLDHSKLKYAWNDNSCQNVEFGFICEEKRVGNSKEKENENKEIQEQTTERDISLQTQTEQTTTERDISIQPEAETEKSFRYFSFNPHTLRRLYSARRERTRIFEDLTKENLEKSLNQESQNENEKLKPALEANEGDVSLREESLAPQGTNPKLLAGETTLNEDSLSENLNSKESSTGNYNKWKSIIKNSLKKAEIDIFKSLFGTVNNISEDAE